MSATLALHQREFAAAITGDDGAPEDLLRPTHRDQAPLLHLYRHAYRSRLTEALQENYPVLHQVLGDEEFDRVADRFIAACPSRHPSIRWFGNELAAFLDREPDQVPHPALIDLVRMEWAMGTAFDGPDGATLRVDDLMQLPADAWPGLRFEPHPTAALIHLEWAVEPLWSALSNEPDAATDAPESLPHHLLVWRRVERTQWRSVTREEAALLQACFAGKPFADLCEDAIAGNGDRAAEVVAGYLRVWIEAGVLSGLR